MNRNYWATYKDSLAYWSARLPSPQVCGMDRLLDFAERILQAGEREQVYRVVESPKLLPFREAPGRTYIEHVRDTLARTGNFCPFNSYVRAAARMAYYEDGRVREESVENLGTLIQRLTPEEGTNDV